MRPPRFARFILTLLARPRNASYLGDVEEIYRALSGDRGRASADRWYRREAFRSFAVFIVESIRWGVIMFKNHFKTAFRMFRRDKGYTFLNTVGLAIGLACFALLMIWVRDEVGWDRFHENGPRIYRLQSVGVPQPAPLGPHLEANYPEIAASVRFFSPPPLMVECGDKSFEESGFVLADASVFDVFTIPFAAGDPTAAFTGPETVVLTEETAARYFGAENPIGRFLVIEHEFQARVTGVVRNPPANSDIRFNILGDFRFVGRFRQGYESHWGNHEYFTYVMLAEGADSAAVIAKIAPVVQAHEPATAVPLTMKPLGRIHLYEDRAMKSVVMFGIVGAFILLVAAFNFINLTTARSGRRAREIAIRKVAGAVRAQLIRQFLCESVLLVLGAYFLALAVTVFVLPAANAVTGKAFRPADILEPGFSLFLLGTAVTIGVLSGAYPALLLSSFRPARLLQEDHPGAGRISGGRLRKILVVAQFSISLVLLISTVFISRQVAFIRNYNVGIQKENIVVLKAKEQVLKNREPFIQALLRRPGVVNATFATGLPSQVENIADEIEWEGMDKSLKPFWSFVGTDDRYLETLGLSLIEGRNFPEATPVNESPLFIVNQRAVEEMKLPRPVGTRFSLWGMSGTIIGVVKDFHFRNLREEVRPLLLFVFPRYYNWILIKIRPTESLISEVLEDIGDVWKTYVPGTPFNPSFLDEAFSRNYQAERKMSLEFKYFSFLGIFISLLGLIGLASFLAEQKRKEIGIRKVLGASVAGIAGLITRELIRPVLFSNLIAWPIAFWMMNAWLRDFACRTTMSLGPFLAAGAAALAIASLTISFQAIRAALANPIRALKRE